MQLVCVRVWVHAVCPTSVKQLSRNCCMQEFFVNTSGMPFSKSGLTAYYSKM